jgi:hypothetical protein
LQGSIFGRQLVLVTAWLLVALTVWPQANESKVSLTGRVADSEGAAIKGARVFVIWDSSGSMLGLRDNVGAVDARSAVTDAAGRYSIELPPGFYDVFVSAGSFSPAADKVRVKAGQTAIHDAKLSVDPIVSRELSGTRVTGGSKR